MTKKKPAGCTCITDLNQELEQQGYNTRLHVENRINLKTGKAVPPRVTLQTVKANSRDRKPKIHLEPTYCPFCGKKY